jgi:uncharacterized protein (DUF1800 family)
MRLANVTRIAAATMVVACAPATTADPARIAAPAELREQTADQQVAHALSRLTFGARPGDIQRVRAMGVDQWIASQLTPQRIDDRTATAFLERFPTISMTAAQLFAEYPRPQQLQQAARRDSGGMSAADSIALRTAAMGAQRVAMEIQSARVARALLSERQLEEVMVDFWENHFSVFTGKGVVRYYLPDYDRAIRPHALGNFRDLLGAVATSPAMLFYLDNAQSGVEPGRPSLVAQQPIGRGRGARPPMRRLPPPGMPGDPPVAIPQPGRRPGLNENYARELLELHTLGVDGGYTQQDVIDVARALTGWTIDAPRGGGRFIFRPAMHDAGPKTVLGIALAEGRGIEDGEQVLTILARHPSTARFISMKLARRFVSDTPPASLVDRAAATFTRTDGDIREVVRTIVTSPEFFSQAAYRSKVKTPFELVVSTLRALDAAPDATPRTARVVQQLGQPIFGKETPNGYPDVADAWLNTGAILNRINFGTMVVSGQVPGIAIDRWPTARAVRDSTRDVQVDAVIASLLGGGVSTDTREILLTGRNPFLDANPNAAADTSTMIDDEPPPMMAGNGRRPLRDRIAGARRAARPLDSFSQIVGQALGSPQIQRR